MFSNVIKVTRKKDTAIQSYSMRDMGRHPEVRREKEPSFTLSSAKADNSGPKVDRLMEEIGDREKYIKQMTEKNQ